MKLPHRLPPGLDQVSVFQSIFKAYPDALLLVDREGVIVLANPAAAQLMGYELPALVGLPVEALVPDSIRPRHAQYREAYGKRPHARPMGTQMDLVAKRQDGSEVMVEISLSPLEDSALPYVVTAIRGIEAYPRVKQALQRARYSDYVARLGRLAVDLRDPQALLQEVPRMAAEALQVESSAVYLLDPSRLNCHVASGFGLEGEEVGAVLPSTPDGMVGYVLDSNGPLLVKDAAAESRFSLANAYLRAGLVSCLAVPLSDRGRTMGVLVAWSRQTARFGEDETRFLASLGNLLASTLQRAQTEEALRHAQRLESVGQLTGGIAHDFNNLLTVIQGNLQVLQELPSILADPHAQQLLASALRAGRRSAELTGKLLAFSRRQVLQPDRLDVGAQLHSLADMLRRTLDQRIAIKLDVAPDCPPCLADAGQLEAALLNLAINARDAMPEGGVLTISCRACAVLPSGVSAEVLAGHEGPPSGQGHVAISLADTGIGMSEEVKQRAFEPFFTTKEMGRGTGLGLSTVYGFARQSHGAVALDSAPGAGTTLTLYIPAASPDGRPETQAPVSAHSVPRGLRVMLVEDDMEVRAVVQRFLEALGCVVSPFASGEEALAALDGMATPELLLSDIALGAGMRGLELARLMQARLPTLAIVLMSGFSSELLDANQEAPAHWELLQKPYGRDDLAAAIARVLAMPESAGLG